MAKEPKWSEQEDVILKLHYLGNNKIELLKLLPGRPWSGITQRAAKKLGLQKHLLWSDKELQLLKNNYSQSNKESMLALLPGRCWREIKLEASKLKIKQSPLIKRPTKANLNKLLEDTEQAYYWIGFLLADGYFTPRGGLSITLSNKDEDHLIKFASFLEDMKIKIFNYQTKTTLTSRYTIDSCVIMPKIQKKFNIGRYKTINPPDLTTLIYPSNNHILALLCGLIDGDGHINKLGKCSIECHKSWEDNLLWLLTKSYFITGTTRLYPIEKNTTTKYTAIRFSSSIMAKIKKIATTFNLPLMERKWQKVK